MTTRTVAHKPHICTRETKRGNRLFHSVLAERQQLYLPSIPSARQGYAASIRTAGCSHHYSAKMGVSHLVAPTSETLPPMAAPTSSSRSFQARPVRQYRALQQPSLGDMGSPNSSIGKDGLLTTILITTPQVFFFVFY